MLSDVTVDRCTGSRCEAGHTSAPPGTATTGEEQTSRDVSNGWSVASTFEGEFSNVTRSYGRRALRLVMSVSGTFETCRAVLTMSVSRG